MSDGMVFVQWADTTGTGFSPQRRGSEAPPEYWTAAEGLLMADLSQPPEGIRDTGEHPIWTLRQVSVGRRRTWCFAVQGRLGDDFGVAGTCRFAFALDEMDAIDAWRRGIEATAVRQPARQLSKEDFTSGVRQVLRSVVADQERIPVGLGPEDTAWVIPTVLAVLPESETRNWSWSTCALLPPGRIKRREISGSWPEEFRSWEPRLAASVVASFQESIATTQDIRRLLHDRPQIDGFEELADQAIRGKVNPELRRTSRDVEEVIARIRRSTRKLDVSHVADMVVTPMGAEELNDHYPKLLTRWADEHPEEASDRLRFVMHPAAASKIVNSLVKSERGHPRNLLHLPTADRPVLDAWHDRLIELLHATYPDSALERLVGSWIEGVWAEPENAAAGRELLRRMGMDLNRYPQFYRAQPGVIVSELATHGRVTERVAVELAYEERPLELLAVLSQQQLPPVPARTAAQLVESARGTSPDGRGQSAAIEAIATGMTKLRLGREAPEDTEDWLRALVSGVSLEDPLSAQLLAGGLRALGESDPEAPRSELLKLSRKVEHTITLPGDVIAILRAAEHRLQPVGVTAQPGAARAVGKAAAPRGLAGPPAEPSAPSPRLTDRRKQDLKRIAFVGGVAAAAITATIAVIVALKPSGDGPDPAPTATTAVAGTPAPVLRSFPRTYDLPGAGNQQTIADINNLHQKIDAEPGLGQVTSVTVLFRPADPANKDKGSKERADALVDQLGKESFLPGAAITSVQGNDPSLPLASTRSMQVMVVYSK